MNEKKVTLIDLINQIGLENIEVQSLLGSVTKATTRKKLGGTEVSFITNQITPNDLLFDGKRKIGLILWIPYDKVPKIDSNERVGTSF